MLSKILSESLSQCQRKQSFEMDKHLLGSSLYSAATWGACVSESRFVPSKHTHTHTHTHTDKCTHAHTHTHTHTHTDTHTQKWQRHFLLPRRGEQRQQW